MLHEFKLTKDQFNVLMRQMPTQYTIIPAKQVIHRKLKQPKNENSNFDGSYLSVTLGESTEFIASRDQKRKKNKPKYFDEFDFHDLESVKKLKKQPNLIQFNRPPCSFIFQNNLTEIEKNQLIKDIATLPTQYHQGIVAIVQGGKGNFGISNSNFTFDLNDLDVKIQKELQNYVKSAKQSTQSAEKNQFLENNHEKIETLIYDNLKEENFKQDYDSESSFLESE